MFFLYRENPKILCSYIVARHHYSLEFCYLVKILTDRNLIRTRNQGNSKGKRSMEINYYELGLGELLESKEHEQTWQAVEDLVFSICCKCDPDNSDEYKITNIVEGVKDFLGMIPKDNMKESMNHLLIFQILNGPNAVIELFTSPIEGNKEIGEEAIRLFLINPKSRNGFLPKPVQNQCALIVLQFCNLLRGTATDVDQSLYNSCREKLVSVLKSIASANRSVFMVASLLIKGLGRVVYELSQKLKSSLSTVSSCSSSSFARDVREFALFSLHMRKAIEEHVRLKGESLPLCKDVNFRELSEIQSFYQIFKLLSAKVMSCLYELGNYVKDGAGGLQFNPMWSYYLSLLKELKETSKLYQGQEEEFSASIEENWLAIDYLIMLSKRSEEHHWILAGSKNAMNFGSRRHLMMTRMMFPVVEYDDEKKMHKLLIDRSRLLTDSFEQLGQANPKLLRNGISVMFKNEGASGIGVLREWLFLVCEHLFNPQNSLFLVCPSDQRRIFPNPAKLDPLRLNYFRFCGRVFALALMHKVQVGIAFDRIFFLQLAGKEISLEDVFNADPCMYKSCKKILEMDAGFMDSDAMGLTFVHEIEEFGSRKVVDLCPGGSTIVVNSKNREEYVNLLIRHCFVKSISVKVAYFAQGFGDILCKRIFQKFFFRNLELKDLDCLLLGNDKAMCVKDWKAHTDYDGYNETDDQIYWFWKVVESMSTEQQRELLFFWTSVKYLPVNGFSGLPSRLYISKTKGSHCHLPSSHTCVYGLGLPLYPSLQVMQQHLFLICQEHVVCGFGLS